jgi:PTH1 family peptidyl-tRNA hydrolase
MKVVVGLGNPGSRYDGTRHNVGFSVVDYLAAGPAVSAFRARFQGLVADVTEGDQQVLLVKPETFMNLSGRCVRQVVDFYKVAPEDLLVVCDDVNLPLGKLRARAKGTHGGQNGLRSIQEHLGTTEYARLRIGIDPPPPNFDMADYVLSRFKPGERAVVEEAVAAAARGVLVWVREGIQKCMNTVNAEGSKGQESGVKSQESGKPARKKPGPFSEGSPESQSLTPDP